MSSHIILMKIPTKHRIYPFGASRELLASARRCTTPTARMTEADKHRSNNVTKEGAWKLRYGIKNPAAEDIASKAQDIKG